MKGTQAIAVLFALLACRSAYSGAIPPPPDKPLPLSAFESEFQPAGSETYPPTEVTAIERFKTIAHYPGKPDWTSEEKRPARPYVVVGSLHFPFAWHDLERDVDACPAQADLFGTRIRAVGGDAILLCEVTELQRGVLFDPVATLSYREFTLQVIRYTDRESAGTPTSPATEGASVPGSGATSASASRRFEGVWYRTPEKMGVLAFWSASGTMTVGADAIVYESKKINLTIPTASIWRVMSTQLWNDDSHHTWSVVEYDEGGLTKTALFTDRHMSRHRNDAAILAELRLAAARGRSEPASVRRGTDVGTGAEDWTVEDLVVMRHYSFKLPSNGSWGIQKPGGPYDVAVLTKQLGPTGYGEVGHVQIKILRNQIFSQKLVKMSARENADKVRRDERKTMLKQGVRRGLYKLHDVSMGEATISGKHFFFMDYTTETPTDIEPSSLYLLFPHERDNTSFLMVVYTAVIDKKTGAIDNSKPDLVSVLSSLELKSVN